MRATNKAKLIESIAYIESPAVVTTYDPWRGQQSHKSL